MKDSTEILKHCCGHFYHENPEKILDWEEHLDAHLGTSVRVYAYHSLLARQHTALTVDMATRSASWVETKVFAAAAERNLIQPNMRKFMGISDASAASSLDRVRSLFAVVGAEVGGGGGGYLVGGRFSAADLTFAALAAPLLHLDAWRGLTPPLETFAAELQATAHELRATPAGQHAARVYGAYRFARLDRATGRLAPPAKAAVAPRIAFRGGGRNNVAARTWAGRFGLGRRRRYRRRRCRGGRGGLVVKNPLWA